MSQHIGGTAWFLHQVHLSLASHAPALVIGSHTSFGSSFSSMISTVSASASYSSSIGF